MSASLVVQAAGRPRFFVGVLDFLLADENDVVAFSHATGTPLETVQIAREKLDRGSAGWPPWSSEFGILLKAYDVGSGSQWNAGTAGSARSTCAETSKATSTRRRTSRMSCGGVLGAGRLRSGSGSR